MEQNLPATDFFFMKGRRAGLSRRASHVSVRTAFDASARADRAVSDGASP